jgi:hypothetical protein
MCEQDTPRVLNEVLQELPSPPSDEILPLPIAHLTTVASFERIVNDGGKLKPSKCQVFNKKLLYFSYGGVFHRHRQEPTQETDLLPVAFLFKPRLLDRMNYFFPYDTGAAYHRRYGSHSDELSQFERYRISNNKNEQYQLPLKLIYYTYGSNQNYLKGKANDSQNLQIEPFITLIKILNTDLTSHGTDHRQYSIECQASRLIDLKKVFADIIWVGLPDDAQCLKHFIRLCKMIDVFSPPAYDTYEVTRVESPYALATMLEKMAKKQIINPRYLHLGV